MTFGAGRPAAHPEVFEIRELTDEDLAGFTPAPAVTPIKKLRDAHHRIAHLFALGYRPGEISEITGYSKARLSVLRNDPAMDNLISEYRKEVMEERQEEADHHFVQVTRARNLALGRLVDKLEDEDVEFTPTQLLAIAADGSDRTGYPKRTVAVNVNVDFAAKLDKAIQRSNQAKVIDGKVLPPVPSSPKQPVLPGGGARGEEMARTAPTHAPAIIPLPEPLRRRA